MSIIQMSKEIQKRIVSLPGKSRREFTHLFLDYTGTLAIDGVLIKEVENRLIKLSEILNIIICTADTFGKAERE